MKSDFDRNIHYFDIIYHSLEYPLILITFYHLLEDLVFGLFFFTFLKIPYPKSYFWWFPFRASSHMSPCRWALSFSIFWAQMIGLVPKPQDVKFVSSPKPSKSSTSGQKVQKKYIKLSHNLCKKGKVLYITNKGKWYLRVFSLTLSSSFLKYPST